MSPATNGGLSHEKWWISPSFKPARMVTFNRQRWSFEQQT